MKRILLLAVLLTAPARLEAQTPDVPVDPHVRIVHLDNGLTVFIRENGRPENRAELRLVVNAGSILENEDQLGMAHLLEHMAFNGTTDFPRQDLIDYLESTGMRFGPDVNAYTSFDETVYELQVPTDSLQQLRTAVHVLREWASEVTLDGAEIDKERGVVLEEWRLGRGADARMRDVELPVMLHGSRYADRLPIGTAESIETAPHEAIRRFYSDWYRPDLMAVVAVGDFDADAMEAMIRGQFEDMPPVDDPKPRPVYPVPLHDTTLVVIASDPEASNSTVRVIYKQPYVELTGTDELHLSLLEQLHSGMFNDRLSELAQQADPPYVVAFGGSGDLVRSAPAYQLLALVSETGAVRGIETLLAEAERVRRYGFTATELERQKTSVLRRYEQAYAERDKTSSARYAAEYIRHFLDDEEIPGIAYEFEFAGQELPGITLREVNALSEAWLASSSRVLVADGPEKDGLERPDEDALLDIFQTVSDATLEPYSEEVSDEPLVPATPDPASVAERSEDETLSTIRVRFENGLRLVMKPTDFQNDEVLLYASSPGGTSLVSDEEYLSATAATSVVGMSGLGAFGPIELEKKLAGKVVSLSPFISEETEGFRGSASTRDVETLLQLVRLYFTEPRADSTAFASFRTRMRGMMQNMGARPESVFNDTMLVTLWQNHPRRQPSEPEDLDRMDLDSIYRVFRDRLADPGDFTFYVVGSFDPDEMVRLVGTWLGSLPPLDRSESARDIGARQRQTSVSKEVDRGIEPKSQVSLYFTGDFDWSVENRLRLSALASALRIKLREVLREDLGGTYGVSVSGQAFRTPEPYYRFSISFGCDPDRVDDLVSTVSTQIDSVKAVGLDETYIQKVHEAEVRGHEVAIEQNGYWLNGLSQSDRNDEDPHRLLTGDAEFLATLTPTDLAAAARRYLDPSRRIQGILRPEAADSR